MSARGWVIAAGVLGFLGVLLGAFGAHGLEGRPELGPKHLKNFETGVRYLQLHALALLAVGWLASVAPSRAVSVAGGSFLAGCALFSGSLVLYALSPIAHPPDGHRWLGAITPLGGLAFMAGWVALAVAARSLPAPKADAPA